MINFRFHRGSLEESLSTVVSFNSFFDLFNYLIHHETFESFSPTSTNCLQKLKSISIIYYSYDIRVCDHLFAILVNGQIIGFCY